MAFFQTPPEPGNSYRDDRLFREYLERRLGAETLAEVAPEYEELAELSGTELYRQSLQERLIEPEHTQWNAWGHRVDEIEVSPLWKRAEELSAKHGLVAVAYEQPYGDRSRIHQFALNFVLQPSLDIYSCPLAMTDGAARTLLDSGNQEIIDIALPHLTSRDPATFWTSGQWMTERTGGSDVGASETVAKKDGDQWRLYGTKWFTSATTSQMTLTLGRPEGNGPGGRGLALFFVELRDEDGRLRNIQVNRLKDKFGTRKVPTAELTLDGTPATLVSGTDQGIRNITPMLAVTRTWNAVAAVWGMRRAVALAKDYARKRNAFGSALEDKALHRRTLAWISVESDAAFMLAFKAAELLGKVECKTATEHETQLFRMITPLAKLTTAKQAVAVCSEAIECFGGAGYVEDTGLPRILADAQVLPIWEGTTNVLSLDTLRALAKDQRSFEAIQQELGTIVGGLKDERLAPAAKALGEAMQQAGEWLMRSMNDRSILEAGARGFAMTLGRCLELAFLCEHAEWVAQSEHDEAAAMATAARFARHGVCHIDDAAIDEDLALLGHS